MSKKLWGGRFSTNTLSAVDAFNASISFDYKLWPYDIQGSLAHVQMLQKQQILSEDEAKKIESGLLSIRQEIERGQFEWKVENEDVHLNIESYLIEKIGPIGGKLHTARSRNDQVALDLRLYCVDQIHQLKKQLFEFQKSLVEKASQYKNTILPGYTHLQRAQPILLGHHLLAYFEMVERDQERLSDLLKRVKTLPLGSGALAGTPFPIDRHFVAQQLGFERVSNNSLDAVSDRDFVIELMNCCSLVILHLSRLAEELILWSTFEFNFVKLPEGFCTGSSMMPQKINPDVLELIRGKTGRVFGNLAGFLTTVKALPLAYNKDLQEDKEPLFDSVETTLTCLQLFAALLKATEFKQDHMLQATRAGFLTATDLADYLVTKGVPFREAHHIAGQTVRHCQEKELMLDELSLEILKQFSTAIEEDVKEWLSVANSVARRQSFGGTALTQVQSQLDHAQNLLQKQAGLYEK